MPDSSRCGQQSRNPFLEEISQLSGRGEIGAISQTEYQILEALKRIEEKLNPPKSAIITGPEVERVIKEIQNTKGGV